MISCFVVIAFAGCKKDGNSTTHLKIYLTDKPFTASEVNVDIQEVRVNLANDSSGWMRINTNAGVYNLLDLQNGIDTVIAQGVIPAGALKEVRFILGSDNSIKVDNTVYPLTIPSGSESGLKIKLNKQLNATLDSLIIDFDAGLSIRQNGVGDYRLQPVLQVR